jgi:hypothetical protein
LPSDITRSYHPSMKTKHRKTLAAIYRHPTASGIVFADIESLIVALGGEVREGDGSRVAFELGASGRLYLHRPHPGKEAKKYQVEDVRAWLEERGIRP